MGRGIKKNLDRLSSSVAIIIIAILSLIVMAGCYDGMLDDIQQKIDEDRIEAGTAPTYTVTYYGNGNTGGDVPLDLTNYTEGETVTVLGNVNDLVKTGNSFTGWNTKADGTGTFYTQGPSLIMGDSNVILYAQWTTNPTYTVTYDDNGSTGGSVPVDTTNYEEGQTVTVLGNTGNLVRTGHSFMCWNTLSNGNGTNYTQGQTFPMPGENEILYAKWIAYVLRDTGPAGGLIFHDKGYYSNGWRYMEAAPSDQSTDAEWGCNGIGIDGADGTAIGTGEQNTIDIEADCATSGTAADICANLALGDYRDWFLPSLDELNLMYINLHQQGVGVFVDDNYWSSSEYDQDKAWGQYFGSDIQEDEIKTSTDRVRAVRAF